MGSLETNTRWSLEDLLPDPVEPAVEQYLARLEKSVSELEALRSELTAESAQETFSHALQILESIDSMSKRLQAYSYLWLSEDTQHEPALNLRDRLDQILVNLSNRILFFEIWFKDLPEAEAERLLAPTGDLKYYLESIRRFKPYTLSEKEESLIALKDTNGIDALINLYDMITNKFSFDLVVEGEKKSLTRDQLTNYYRHSSPEIRSAAYQELYRVYGDNATILAQIYNHRVRDWHTEAIELRGYASPISARNLGNDLPDKVVETLLAVCRANAPVFQRYFQYKAGALGLDKLRRYDIYTPLANAEKKYDFPFAMQLVLDSFTEFSPEMAGMAKRVLEQKHLDSEIRHRKRGGGFNLSVLPELTPWVLVNFNGHPGDIATLAHELGHAVHAMLAGNHSVMTFHPPQPLAETASIFAEMLLTERMLREEQDPAVRRDLLVRVIDDAYATVLRQAYIAMFEQVAHKLIGEGISSEDLAERYYSDLKDQFGQAVELSEEFKWEWITIPHIYESPFYTYSYSFGQLLVLALYQQYRNEGSTFVPKYLKILSHGGSKAPLEILQEAGLDVSTASFWQGGFDVLDTMITELTQIA
jgi:oligoendopeptidase F